jgi:SAM-dependent methyltransferase
VLSFEKRDPRDAIWLPQGQFLRTFVLPLLVNQRFEMPIHQVFLNSREGLEPEDLYALCGWAQRMRPPFLTLVSIPKWLSSWRGGYDPAVYRRRLANHPDQAMFILSLTLKRLSRLLERMTPPAERRSRWSTYITAEREASLEFAQKRAFLEGVLDEVRPRAVLDIGCNRGYHAAMAARSGARVVAIDYDPVMVAETWRMAVADNLDILPLVVDITRPSPATGWRNLECPSFIDRAQQGFDAVVMLAVIHHMIVTERVPLSDILDLAADLTRDIAVIEFVGPDDPLFRRLARGREHLFVGLNAAAFEAAASVRFEIVRSRKVAERDRQLYVLRKK